MLWNDPNTDGNPNDAQVLATIPGNVISNAGINTFVTSTFRSCITVTNSFFVGFLVSHNAGQFPGAFDETAPLPNRSFVTGGASGNITNLTMNDLPLDTVDSTVTG